jgi:hypothetical protein
VKILFNIDILTIFKIFCLNGVKQIDLCQSPLSLMYPSKIVGSLFPYPQFKKWIGSIFTCYPWTSEIDVKQEPLIYNPGPLRLVNKRF